MFTSMEVDPGRKVSTSTGVSAATTQEQEQSRIGTGVSDHGDLARRPPLILPNRSLAPAHLLFLEFVGVVLFTGLTLLNAYVVFPARLQADLGHEDVVESFSVAVSFSVLFPGYWATFIVCSVVLQQACREVCSINAMRCGAVADMCSRGALPGYAAAGGEEEQYSMKIDSEALSLTAKFTVTAILALFISFALFGSVHATSPVTALVWCYGVFRVLPIAAQRWNQGGFKPLMPFMRRFIVSGFTLVVLPISVVPLFLKLWSPDQVSFYYPLVVSFFEYLIVSCLFNNDVVRGYSDEALSIVARWVVAVCDSSRIGILVVVANAPEGGSFKGLIDATAMGLVFEALARNNLISIAWRGGKYCGQWLWRKLVNVVLRGRASYPLPPPQLNNIKRFKLVYIGVKVDTEYWGVYMLILMKCLNWGFGAGDPETGHLADVLNCPWNVIGVVALGELVGDLLALLIGWCMVRYAPQHLHVYAPALAPGDAGLVVVMWLNVGGFYLNGISSMGVLASSL